MRKFWIAAAVLLAIAAGIWFWKSKQSGTAETTVSGASNLTGAATPPIVNQRSAPEAPANSSAVPDSTTSLAARAASPPPTPATNPTPTLPPLTVLDNARVAIHNYQAQFGENPVGTNPEITAALMGQNPKNLNFIGPESGLRVNAAGELIDAYGTPFFFHQLSGKEMEIRSAGPDKIMWSYDDLVTR